MKILIFVKKLNYSLFYNLIGLINNSNNDSDETGVPTIND